MKYKKELLGSYIDILSGFAFKRSDFVECGIPIIKITNINSPNVTLNDLTYVSRECANKQKKFYLSYNDVLIAMTGSHINQITSVVGRVARVKYHKKTLLNQRVGKITIKKDAQADINYIYYFLTQDIVKYELALKAGGAANQANISSAHIKGLEFPCPELNIQKKIGAILSAYDDLIENNQKQIKVLEESAQRLYKEWFVDLHFPGYETTPIIDGVPEGWRKSLVGECAIILRRGISPAYNENGKYKVINQKCIRQTVVDFAEARKQEKVYSDDLNLLDSDTVICSTGAGTLGRVGQIFGNYPKTTFDSHITLVRANEMIGKQYLFHVLKSYQSYLMGMGKGSTNQLELSRNTIQELTVYVPTFELKIKFEALVQPIHDKISLLNKKIKYLYEARDRLLPKLMSGELEV